MTLYTATETCSCGATIRVESDVNSTIGNRLMEWRTSHRHEFPPLPMLPTFGLNAPSADDDTDDEGGAA